MRALEALLLLADIAAYLALVTNWRWRWPIAMLAMAVAILQLLAEGARWQMAPGYGLAFGLFVVVAARRRSGARPGRLRPWAHWSALGVGGMILTAAIILPLALPVFRLPAPQGPYAIGTTTYDWRDPHRSDLFTNNPADAREVVVQVWYPAQPRPSARPAPYVENAGALGPLARLLGLPAFALGHLQYIRTHAVASAPVADPPSRFPVLIFLSGRGGYRQSNTVQVEALVSHGYVVAAIDQPHAAAGVVLAGGRVIPMDPRMFDPSHPGHGRFLDTAGVIPYLGKDVTFVLDRLAAADSADAHGLLTGRLDVSRTGIFGVSLGGIVGSQACLDEPRLHACLVMDAFAPPDVVREGLAKPTMWLTRDSRMMQQEGWRQDDIVETQSTMQAAFERLRADGYVVRIDGMFHPNFSDAPLLSPLASAAGLTGPIDGRRGLDIINAYSLAFFDHTLKGAPAPLLDGGSTPYREVTLESRHNPSPPHACAARRCGPGGSD